MINDNGEFHEQDHNVLMNDIMNQDMDLRMDDEIDTRDYVSENVSTHSDEGSAEAAAAEAAAKAQEGAGESVGAGDDENKLVFTTDFSKTAESDEDKMISELKAKGYNVEKTDTDSVEKQFETRLNHLDGLITQANDFIKQPHLAVVTEKVKTDKRTYYKSIGKEASVGSPEFNLEVEAELDRYKDDPVLTQIYADNIRNEVRNGVLAKAVEDKQKLDSEIGEKIKEREAKTMESFQAAFKEHFEKGIMGVTFSNDQINEAYSFVLSGKLAQVTKDNPSILTELALIHLNRERFAEKLGGPTYGEGVRAAAAALTSDDKKRAHLGTAVQKGSAGSGNSGFKSDWSDVVPTEEIKEQRVAGRPLHL